MTSTSVTTALNSPAANASQPGLLIDALPQPPYHALLISGDLTR